MPNLYELTAHDAADLLRRKEVTSLELTRSVLERIAAVDDRVKSFVTVTAEKAEQQARAADEQIARGDMGLLTGVPVVIKDVLCTEGVRTTCSSRMLENFVPPYSATVVGRLFGDGAVMVGKANMDEFAMGSSTENSAFFPTHNPWALDRVPGGSSGGSAAAVAAQEGMVALGSDTGGSIRQPAGFCNVTGLKPTYGRVSRYGLVAFSSSLDQVGPMARDAEDCALTLQVIAGYDRHDGTSVEKAVPDYRQALKSDLKGLRLGVPKEYFVDGMQPEVEQSTRAAILELERLGATVEWDVSLPSTSYALAVYYIIAPSEASSNLARYDGVKYGHNVQAAESMWDAMERTRQEGFGPEVKRRIMLGAYALSAGYYDAYYLKAQKVRTLISREFDAAFSRYDALITPTSPTVPFKMGEKLSDPVQMYLSDVCTIPVNIAGLPAMSVPAGFAGGLPIGMQIIGRAFDETTILRIGHAYQQATSWHKQWPKL
ncbi:MAG: Asp-tRNA(Asn)/Glu-tRNA(Gln) amidotransferase subunit GatA [Dehalococcoidia bacterium]|nr:Asp-tRNA(Asn)/Glu-tRNA(Gln) amidotransferase subunit GatA [Dehalococcoidia bacterium]